MKTEIKIFNRYFNVFLSVFSYCFYDVLFYSIILLIGVKIFCRSYLQDATDKPEMVHVYIVGLYQPIDYRWSSFMTKIINVDGTPCIGGNLLFNGGSHSSTCHSEKIQLSENYSNILFFFRTIGNARQGDMQSTDTLYKKHQTHQSSSH